jgi:hypothetical protein
LASVTWFLQDVSTYGIAIFMPLMIEAAFAAEDSQRHAAAQIDHVLLGAEGTALVDVGLLIIFGVFLFQFMTNLGPNCQSYLLTGELFPVRLCGLGSGFDAASGKLGAVIAAFLFPGWLSQFGRDRLLALLALASLLGALIIWRFRIESRVLNWSSHES